MQHIKILQIIDYLPPTLAEISLTVQSNRGNKIYVSQNLTCDTTTLMWIYKISRVDGKLTSFPPYGKPEQRMYKNFKLLRTNVTESYGQTDTQGCNSIFSSRYKNLWRINLHRHTCMCITILKYITLMPAISAFNILQFIIWIISKKEKDSFQKKRDSFKDNNSSFTK